MKPTSTKSIMVNIVSGFLVLGVLGLGYITFFQNNSTTTTTPSGEVVVVPAMSGLDTVAASAQVAKTVSDLKNLNSSVEASSKLFTTDPAFKSLKDFSVPIASESIGSEDPFVKTAWRLNFDALEKAAAKKAAAQNSTSASMSTAAASTRTVTSSSTSAVVPSTTTPSTEADTLGV